LQDNKKMISVVNIPQLNDNFSYAIVNKKKIIIIDPAESISIINFIKKNKLNLISILLTHHHSDHTAGVEKILNFKNVPVYSPSKKIKFTTTIVKDKDSLKLDFINIEVITNHENTKDHIIYYCKEHKLLFSGDTLFRLGCGRIFEGTYKQMYNSLKKINLLEDDTKVYCGHEYTKNNLDFLTSIFNDSEMLRSEKQKIITQIQITKSSIPFNLGMEKTLNPFLSPGSELFIEFKKCHKFTNFELFTYLRDLKNKF